MRIRPFDFPTDIASIMGFVPELYESNFTRFVAGPEFMNRKRAQLREAARDPGQAVLVCEDDDGIAGFIWLVVEVEYSGRRRGEVAAIHVARRCRGLGYGRLLMDEGETLLRSYGCSSVHLMVTAANEAAVSLYQSLGYDVTRHQMEKSLKPGARS